MASSPRTTQPGHCRRLYRDDTRFGVIRPSFWVLHASNRLADGAACLSVPSARPKVYQTTVTRVVGEST